MPVLGLVAHVGEPDRVRLSEHLHAHPAFSVGTAGPRGLPLVLDVPSREEERAAWDWLHARPEITHVDVVFADFADVVSPEAP